MMKATIEQICKVYNILNAAKVAKMNSEDRVAMVRIMRVLKPHYESFIDYQKQITDKLKPEGFDLIAKKLQAEVALTEEERMAVIKLDIECKKPTQEELAKEVELEIKALTDDSMSRLIESNDFSMAQITALYDVIGQ